MAVYFEDAGFSTFRDFPKRSSFYHGEIGDGSNRVNAICCRPEISDDVVYGTDVDTFRFYA